MHKGLKWFARLSGLIVTIFFIAFFIGEGVPDLSKANGDNLLYFIPFCIPAFIGFVIAWFKPYTGGIIMIIGSLLMGSYFVYYADFRMAMVFGIPALLIGLSFIASVHKELV
jgi:hypothetical protein